MVGAKNKVEALYAELRQEIRSRKHGERFLSIRGIIKKYAVSQFVVDRAIHLLRNEKLLNVVPGSGLYVCGSGEEGSSAIARKTVLLQVPHWPSVDIQELNETVERINHSSSLWNIKMDCFDFSTAIPRNLDSALRRADGMIIRPASGVFQQADLNALTHYCSLRPTVVFGRSLEGIKTDCVGVDNYFAAGIAILHLVKHGHKRIGLLISEPHTRGIRERVRGAIGFAKLNNVEIDLIDCKVISGEMATAKTYNCFQAVLKTGFQFTALLGVSGESIQGAINACLNCRLRIPEDLSVVAIAAESLTQISSPPLDTVPADISGQLTVALDLIDRAAERKGATLSEEIFLHSKLIQCGSVLDIAKTTKQGK